MEGFLGENSGSGNWLWGCRLARGAALELGVGLIDEGNEAAGCLGVGEPLGAELLGEEGFFVVDAPGEDGGEGGEEAEGGEGEEDEGTDEEAGGDAEGGFHGKGSEFGVVWRKGPGV